MTANLLVRLSPNGGSFECAPGQTVLDAALRGHQINVRKDGGRAVVQGLCDPTDQADVHGQKLGQLLHDCCVIAAAWTTADPPHTGLVGAVLITDDHPADRGIRAASSPPAARVEGDNS